MAERLRVELNQSAAWKTALPGASVLCRRAAKAAFRAAAAQNDPTRGRAEIEVALLLADDDAIRRLNHDFRGQDKPTNVLAFPALEDEAAAPGEPLHLGDVALALETCRAEAKEQGKSLADHLAHLVVHGVLHLMGFEHDRPADARQMEALEVAVLGDLGIADPYRGGRA